MAACKKLETEKICSDNHALRLSKELMSLKDHQKVPQTCFTQHEEIPITVSQLVEYNEWASSDSMFAGTLALHLIGAEKLKTLSVTGAASHRYVKHKNPDGSLVHPASEKMDPLILNFICEKVFERVAMRVGPENIAKVRNLANEKRIHRYLAEKISNLRKSGRNSKNKISIVNENVA
ncbi:uncharacterized protein LOC129752747 [Uranotaenia lowii]|uniref:uncharacterized protein LOC129752747 n=1 Tax=Uranotaenia lowii TaxID=190385 RepID=UPI0024789F9E|nr:uncharacterized protein LOC129752747 [Uranotaenia lowii]